MQLNGKHNKNKIYVRKQNRMEESVYRSEKVRQGHTKCKLNVH